MESDSDSKNQKCLAFWVIFGIFAMVEVALGKFILWLPFWPYVKGVATFLFLIADFGVASYVYKSLMKIYPSESPQILYLMWNVLLMLMEDCIFFFTWLLQSWKCISFGEAEENTAADGQEVSDKPIIWQETFVNTNENAERWEKPNVGWIKLNTDGSIDKGNAGFGGLLRDHNGDAICGFVTKAPLDYIFLVELWAIWRGLVLALGLGIKVIWIESDSMSAVKTISIQQTLSGKGHQCLNHIWALLKNFDKYRISYVW